MNNDGNKFIRGIMPSEFAMNRSLELFNLIQRVKYSYSNKLAIQKLPCHLRRRSASHKPYKLPFRRKIWNNTNTNTTNKKIKKKKSNITKPFTRKRRLISRKGYFEQLLSNRLKKHSLLGNTKAVHLTSYLWHAKRFKIAKYTNWIYCIPFSCMFKTYRPSCRAIQGYSVLIDISYFMLFEIETSHDAMIEIFNNYTNNAIGNDIQSRICSYGLCEGETILNGDLNNMNVIGPIKYTISIQKNITKLWIWNHPTCTKHIEDLLSKITNKTHNNVSYELLSKKQKFNRYRLIGPQSLEFLFDTLIAYDDQIPIDNNNSPVVISLNEISCNNGKLWNRRQNDGRCVYNILVKSSLIKKPKQIKHYKPPLSFEHIHNNKTVSHLPNDMIYFHTNYNKSIVNINNQQYIAVSVILNQSFDKLQDHIDIIVRDSIGGRRLWNALTSRNICVGGLRELQTYFYCNSQPIFPFDYPDSIDYYQSTIDYYTTNCMDIRKNQLLPPKTRIRFDKIRQLEYQTIIFNQNQWIHQWLAITLDYIENCFLSIPTYIPTIDNITNIHPLNICRNGVLLRLLSNYFNNKCTWDIEMDKQFLSYDDVSSMLIFVCINQQNSRGCPKSLATIHLPTCEYMLSNCIDINDKDIRNIDFFDGKQFSVDMNWPFLIIGQCTSGGYSYKHGFAISQGFISCKALLHMIHLNIKAKTIANNSNTTYRNMVLTRNRGSQRYIKSYFSIQIPSYQL